MNNLYINGLPNIPLPPNEGEKGKQGNNILINETAVNPGKNDFLIQKQNGITTVNVYEEDLSLSKLYTINYSNKPNYTYSKNIKKDNNFTTITITLSNINESKKTELYYVESNNTELIKIENFEIKLNSPGKNISIYLYYFEKPYKIKKYLLDYIIFK